MEGTASELVVGESSTRAAVLFGGT